MNFLKKAQAKAGYESVMTPHIGHKNLYVTSGHYEKYGDEDGMIKKMYGKGL